MSGTGEQLEQRASGTEEVRTCASFNGTHPSIKTTEIRRVKHGEVQLLRDAIAVEEPLEIQLVYGAANDRKAKSISITMRTPGNDEELAAGFLMTEGVVRDATHIASIGAPLAVKTAPRNEANSGQTSVPMGM